MNEKTQHIIQNLRKYNPSVKDVDGGHSIAIRYRDSLSDIISVNYQMCFTVANLHFHVGSLDYLKAWFDSELGKYFSNIEMVTFPFDDIDTLVSSLRELSSFYKVSIDEQRLLRDIKNESPIYIVVFLIPKIFLQAQ